MKEKNQSQQTFVYIKFFVLALVLILFISLGIRIVTQIQSATFKGYSYNLLVLAKKSYVVSINTNTKTLTLISFKKDRENLSMVNVISDSVKLGIPINGILSYRNNHDFKNFYKEFFSWDNIISVALDEFRYRKKYVNSFDILKLYFAFKSIKPENIRQISLNSLNYSQQANEVIQKSLTDPIIFNEKNSIEVINSSGVNGLGGAIAHMLENTGYNVIAISTDDDKDESTLIIRTTENNTTRGIQQLFPITAQVKKENGVADISIILGKDMQTSLGSD